MPIHKLQHQFLNNIHFLG
jgi:tRNA splicing endonuclease